MVSSIGSFVAAASAFFFIYIVYRTLTVGEKCPDNPWGEGATTLEWTVSSPPPFHTFEDLPVVTRRRRTELGRAGVDRRCV